MKKFNTSCLTGFMLVMLSFGGFSPSRAQLVGGEVFLKGKFIEVGLNFRGACGSDFAPPAGYHPRVLDWSGNIGLGFVADPLMDGWTVGTPDYIGDYFLPGSPHEGWDIQIGGTWNTAWTDNATFQTRSGPLLLTGANTDYYTEFSKLIGVWEGSMGDLAITRRTIVDTNRVYFVMEVTLENTGTGTLEDIYYRRTVDPDNDNSASGGTNYTTINTIEFQPTADDEKCLVSARGVINPDVSYLGLGTVDCRAKCYIDPVSFPPSANPNNLYESGTGVQTAQGWTNTNDCGIGLLFKVGDLAPGESTTLAYAYILREADLDSAFQVLKGNWNIEGNNIENGDTLIICRGKQLSINITGGNTYEWGEWTPSTGLSNPSGRNNILTVQNEIITYQIIGTTTICPKNDTLTLTIIPVGDTTVINQSVCNGTAYDFNGQLVYETGTYFQTYSTVVDGCDSVIRLNLTVNPLPGVEVTVDNNNICDNETAIFNVLNPTPNTTYQWYRDGTAITGATNTTYISPPIAGTYRIVGTTDKGCTDTSRVITLRVNPAAEVEINHIDFGKVCVGDTITVSVNELPGYEYYWTPEKAFRYTSGSRQSIAQGVMNEEINNIQVKGINQYGCIAFDEITVIAIPCCEVALPTAFSPNNDGLNDYFNIILQPGQKVVSFQIFDRLGNIVYDNNNYTKGWNGNINNSGDPAPQAVYFYRIVYSCTDGENYEAKGDITLVR